MKFREVLVALALVFATGGAQAAIEPPAPVTAPVAGVRVALVIGNAQYSTIAALQNVPKDVQLVSAALRDAGWTVTVRADLTKAQMVQALADFGAVAEAADYALVYYAGAGAERGAHSYFAGVDLNLGTGSSASQLADLRLQTITLDDFRRVIARARFDGVAIVDADRTNFLHDTPLVQDETTETLDVLNRWPVLTYYSSSRGDPAQDGLDGNSPFARAFAEALSHPGLQEAAFFRRVRERVELETESRQTPAAARSTNRLALSRTFRFNATREPTPSDLAILASATPPVLSDQPRLALLIGNSDYNQDRDVDDDRRSAAVRREGFAPDLPNPTNDARDLKASLEKLRFTVDLVENADYQTLVDKLFAFEKEVIKAGPDALVIIYYAGHAIQVGGANYLIPVGAKLPAQDPRDMLPEQAELMLNRYALPLQSSLMERLRPRSPRGLNLLILDACRENPWEARTGRDVRGRGVARGLADIRTTLTRTVISYATKQGDIADDGDGRNSPYTTALLGLIERPLLTVGQLMDAVSLKVIEDTGGLQTPYYYGPGIGGTCFSLCPAETPAPTRPSQPTR